jgi:hypothetical protein
MSKVSGMAYNEMSYLDKLDALQDVYGMSSSLAEAIGVSRRSLPNWRDRPESIKPAYRLNIDILYCKHFLIPEWDKQRDALPSVLLPDDMSRQPALWMPLLRRLSFGTIEIESHMSKSDFERAIDTAKLPGNMSRETFYEAFNTFVTLQWLWQKIVVHGEPFHIADESIKGLHTDFMRGLRDDAGFYSTNIRVMGRLENVHTTLPEDIPEEVNRWVFKCGKAATLDEIARAHAWFIAIHPFGDGNGRVGRALVMAQCLNAGLMPPLLNSRNQAVYYAAMEHAMVHGRHTPLIRLFHEAAKTTVEG